MPDSGLVPTSIALSSSTPPQPCSREVDGLISHFRGAVEHAGGSDASVPSSSLWPNVLGFIARVSTLLTRKQPAQPATPPRAPHPRADRGTASRTAGTTASTRRSRKDAHLHSNLYPLPFHIFPSTKVLAGLLPSPVLPPFPYLDESTAAMSYIPPMPRVISPSPTPSEKLASAASDQDGYFGPVTRSATRKRLATPQPVDEPSDGEDEYTNDPEFRRSRTRSRSPMEARVRRMSGLTQLKATGKQRSTKSGTAGSESLAEKSAAGAAAVPNGKAPAANDRLQPPQPTTPMGGWSWRDFSRSPSPLGLIPIHRHWRTLVHKHEVPRKVLHVSIGFFVIWLYVTGSQTAHVAPYLMAALIPIALTDWLRHKLPAFNRIYVMVLGLLMRESEFSGWNGVIFYLAGAWIVLRYLPKDVAVMAVLLLSWCDTAASTFGRLYGRYTPRIRRGKSLAGSTAAFLVGAGTAAFFWGWLAPRTGPFPGDENFPFMYRGTLGLPERAVRWIGASDREQVSVGGGVALAILSIWSGFVAAASEVVDVFGWDDNLTIPVLSGLGIWGFLKVFG